MSGVDGRRILPRDHENLPQTMQRRGHNGAKIHSSTLESFSGMNRSGARHYGKKREKLESERWTNLPSGHCVASPNSGKVFVERGALTEER